MAIIFRLCITDTLSVLTTPLGGKLRRIAWMIPMLTQA